MVELKEVHRQRLKAAVEAANSGALVRFQVVGDRVIWHQGTGKTHVLCNGYGDLEPWKAALTAEFNRMLGKRRVV